MKTVFLNKHLEAIRRRNIHEAVFFVHNPDTVFNLLQLDTTFTLLELISRLVSQAGSFESAEFRHLSLDAGVCYKPVFVFVI